MNKEIYDFGKRLSELRKKAKLTQKDVANRLEIHEKTIGAYENNTVTPSLEKLLELATIYRSSVDYILGLENRSHLYIDDLNEKQKGFILEILNQVKTYFND